MPNCLHCHSANLEKARFCVVCGKSLSATAPLGPRCPKCGTSYAPDTRFCEADGSSLIPPEAPAYRCSVCGRQYALDTKFCPQDGSQVIEVYTAPIPPGIYLEETSGVSLKYPRAPLGRRFMAYLLDTLIGLGLAIPSLIFIIAGIASLDSNYEDEAGGMFVLGIIFYSLPLLFSFMKDGFGQGQSPGKKAMNLMVVNLADNVPCTKGRSALRTLIQMGVAYFTCGLLEPILVLASATGRRLGDLAANTQVINVSEYEEREYPERTESAD